jgi:hypothetical protein
MNFRPMLITLLLAFFGLTASAQTDSAFLLKATRSLTDYIAVNPIEKVYLHLDRPAYYPGDTIWFKAYTVVGDRHQLSAMSGVLYCELVNGNDSVVVRHTLRITAGITWGDFAISRAYKPGNYHVRAYTSWMRNAGPDYFFNQRVKVLGSDLPNVRSSGTKADEKPDVQFFPEGGELVTGLRSKVAVKCVRSNGSGEDISGTVIDNDGNAVAAFTTQHLGMGIFALTPQPGKTYKAKITTADSTSLTADLPAAREAGFALTVNNNNPDTVYVKIAANDKQFHDQQNNMFYLLAQSAGKACFTTQSKLFAPVFTIGIAKNRFPSGIAQITLFSQNGEPLNERIIFIRNADSLNIKLTSPSSSYAARQKVKIGIDTKNDTAHAVIGSFSVAVINESRVQANEDAESTILNYLLLTSDLKGYIEQPNYYFNNTDDQKRADLDVLMLTQGYRRFEWKQVLSNTPQKLAYKPESSLQLEGSLKTPAGVPLPKGKVTLLATSANLITDTTTDVNGIFRFTNLNLPDTARIVLRARKQNNGSNVAIYLKEPDYPAVVKSNQPDVSAQGTLTPEMIKNIAQYKEQLRQDSLDNAKKLKGVTITAKKESQPDIFNNYGTAIERDADMKKLRSEQVVTSQAIINTMPGLAYQGNRFSYGGKSIRVIIDGLRPNKQDDVDFLSVSELEDVRLIDASGGQPTTLVVTTKRYAGTDTVTNKLKGVTIRANKIQEKPDLSTSSNLHGGGNADQVIMGDKLGDCINVSDCLNGRVLGVKFAFDGTPSSTRNGSLTSGSTMSVIIDGIILPGSSLNDLNKNDIYSIEVLRSGAAKAIYGTSIQPGGALVITTRRASDPKYVTSQTPAGLITYPFQGYHKARVFYSPKYDHPKTENDLPDTRTTIYWSPNIITDKDGKASFEYYNADTKGTYRVVVEGIDENGRLGRAVYRYKVE